MWCCFPGKLATMQSGMPNLAIVAVCARPFVSAAARAGYRVAAFDMFNDGDTQDAACYSEQVGFSSGGFDAEDLWRKLSALDSDHLIGVAYGSGLENQSGLLKKISRRFRLLGNSPEVVAYVKDPRRFFPLLDALDIAYPEVRFDIPDNADGWLAKQGGGAGGTHIRRLNGETTADGCYYQRMVKGRPVSVLFLADGRRTEVIGFNEQWLAPIADMPFRYGGAIGNALMPDGVKERMANAACRVTATAGLRGLNSMDFMLSGDKLLALEVNPRLSATFDLYSIPDLFERHLQACLGEIAALPPLPQKSKAHLVFYAPADVTISDDMAWPEWAVDLPPTGAVCKAGEPLCSVLAEAADAEAAKALVFARARQLGAQLRIF